MRADGTVDARRSDGSRAGADLRAPTTAAIRAVAIVLHARLPLPRARAAIGRDRTGGRLHPGLGQPRGQPADEAGRARRHHRGGRLPVADPAPLRRPGRGRAAAACGCMFMQSNGGLADARRFQGKDAILSGPAGGIVGMVRRPRAGRLRQDHRLRHGRHLDRRRRTTPASSSARSTRRSPACGMRAPMMRSTRSPRAAARSCTSTARASGSGRTAPAPTRARPATAAAGRSPSPTPT